MRVVMSGGGTAGHVYPALAVAERLVAEGDSVDFVGTPNGLEARLVPEAGVSFHGLKASGFDRARPWTLLTSSTRILVSTLVAWRRLGVIQPDVVIGFGGYVSIPVGLAAAFRGIPLVIHEQNSVPGLANRFLARRASRIALTYERSARVLDQGGRAIVTGNPVRSTVVQADRTEGRRSLGVPEDAILLLAFGGSRGARHLNRALVEVKDRILAHEDSYVIHVVGALDAASARESFTAAADADASRWRIVDYLDEMPSALAAADLVVARAGATSIAEITARGIAAILVPYPFATDDHQTHNASAVAEAGGAVVIADADLDTEHFANAVDRLLGDASERANMAAASRAVGRPDAAEHVAAIARDVALARSDDRM